MCGDKHRIGVLKNRGPGRETRSKSKIVDVVLIADKDTFPAIKTPMPVIRKKTVLPEDYYLISKEKYYKIRET